MYIRCKRFKNQTRPKTGRRTVALNDFTRSEINFSLYLTPRKVIWMMLFVCRWMNMNNVNHFPFDSQSIFFYGSKITKYYKKLLCQFGTCFTLHARKVVCKKLITLFITFSTSQIRPSSGEISFWKTFRTRKVILGALCDNRISKRRYLG